MNFTHKINPRSATRIAMLVRLGFLAGSVVLLPTASAHTVMTSPLPRLAGAPGSQLTTGPCGVARTTTQPVTMPPLTPGAPLTVTWSETINHPGCFHVDFSTDGDVTFQPLGILAHSTAGALPRAYSTTITLPTTPCATCTLRVRQIQINAGDPPAGTCPETGNTTYFSCANVVLGTAGAGTGGTSGTGGAVGTGGTTGTGGSGTTGTGGRTGSGGSATGSGGAVGTGGVAAGSGGTPGTGGTTTAGSGGSAPGTGGSGPGSGGATATGGTTGTGAADTGGGCAYAGSTTAPGLAAVPFAGILVALALRRRRGNKNKSERS